MLLAPTDLVRHLTADILVVVRRVVDQGAVTAEVIQDQGLVHIHDDRTLHCAFVDKFCDLMRLCNPVCDDIQKLALLI